MPAVSVIVPIYNTEQFIEQCVISLMEQTLESIELIFVNDCSCDQSVQVLESVLNRYPKTEKTIRILHHEFNQGQAAVRKTGIMAATGDYIIHCDSDDWVDVDMYERMHRIAVEQNADIVLCNVCRHLQNGYEAHHCMACDTNRHTALCNLYNGSRMGALWSHLVKREIAQCEQIVWPEWNYTEDLALVFQYTLMASTLAAVDIDLYHYRENPSGITRDKRDILRPDVTKTHALMEMLSKQADVFDELTHCRLALQFRQKARRFGECAGSDNEAQAAWYSVYPDMGWRELFKAQLSAKQKIYAAILLLRVFPLLNKWVNLRNRIWS